MNELKETLYILLTIATFFAAGVALFVAVLAFTYGDVAIAAELGKVAALVGVLFLIFLRNANVTAAI